MFTWLRIVVSCFCLVLCFLFAALWVRSYYYCDYIHGIASSPVVPTHVTSLVSLRGEFSAQRMTQRGKVYVPAVWEWLPHVPIEEPPYRPGILGFEWSHTPWAGGGQSAINFPIWFLWLTNGTAAFIAKPMPCWRFGLRELFVLSTIAAITIGTLTAVLRAISP